MGGTVQLIIQSSETRMTKVNYKLWLWTVEGPTRVLISKIEKYSVGFACLAP